MAATTQAGLALDRGTKCSNQTEPNRCDRPKVLSSQDWANWQSQGFVLLPGAVPADLVDNLLGDLADFRATCGETKDEFGYGNRIGVFHVANENSRCVAFMPKVVAAVAELMNDDPVLMGSLTFEVGTQQGAHVDAMYFYVLPETSMVGAWVALEDVHPDAGPLFYYPGSHRWKFDKANDVWQRFPEYAEQHARLTTDQHGDYADRMHGRWYEMLQERIAAERATKQLALIKKGDCFIWHGNLVHGGMARNDRALSRRSMVSHFIGKGSSAYDFPKFFLHTSEQFANGDVSPYFDGRFGIEKSPSPVVSCQQGLFIRHEKPVVY